MIKSKHPLVSHASAFALAAHTACKQVRKYTGEPYIVHPFSVAEIVESVGGSVEMIAAALLHDVVEDCNIPLDNITACFGPVVSGLVAECSHVDRANDPRKLNRFERMAIELARAADISPAAQTIKLADLIDNTSTIVEHDPKFAEVYMAEKRRLLLVLVDGDHSLWRRAANIVNAYFGAPLLPEVAEPVPAAVDPMEWRSGAEYPPAPGVYERRFDWRPGGRVFAKFDGSEWKQYVSHVSAARVVTNRSEHQRAGEWRGPVA